MHVLLIAPPIMDRVAGRLRPVAQDKTRECPPYGIYMLASVLRSNCHQVTIADLIAQGSRSLTPFQNEIASCSLVGIGATSMSWATAVSVIGEIRKVRPRVPIVLGGIHPTMFDKYLLAKYQVDFVVRGEGEFALSQLCDVLENGGDLASVPNLSWKSTNGEIIRNTIPALLNRVELSKYPMPSWEELPAGKFKGISIESSRGCAFDCSFCSTSYRQSWRGFPPEAFVDRLELTLEHLDRTKLGYVQIVDDEFSLNTKRAIEIARIIRKRQLNPWLVFDSRANDLLVDGYVENIAEYTCQFLVGAECGYDEGLQRIGKGTTCESLEGAAKVLYQHGISDRADFSFILGLPWESVDEVMKTVKFAMHLHATYGVRVLLQWYLQIPGSRLWETDREAGLVNAGMYDHYGFFRDHYLFRCGVRLAPKEIWEVGETISMLQYVGRQQSPDRNMIEFSFPQAIYDNYPRELLDTENELGLASLRQVARPNKKTRIARKAREISRHVIPDRTGLPRRTFPIDSRQE